MSEAPTTQNSFSSAYQNVKSALETREVEPDDAEQLYRLLKPLEAALATVTEAPSGETPVDKISRLLWFKTHTEKFDASFVIRSVGDHNPLIRIIAIAMLREFAQHQRGKTDQEFFFSAQRVVNDQSRIESSPLVSYMLEQATAQFRQVSTRKSVPPNPYVAGVAIRNANLFFGRTNLVRDIAESFERDGVKGLLLFGARRTGKTSLLLHLERGALGDGFAPVFIDVQNAAGKKAIVPLILSELAKRWPNLVDALGQATGDDAVDFDLLRTAIRTVIKHLQGVKLLLMFDEYEVLDSFFSDQASVARMQSLLENESALLVLFAGPLPLNEVSNKHLLALLDSCKYLPITFLDKEDSARLIQDPCKGILTFSDAAVGKIQQLCGGHPFYVQLICQSAFTLKAEEGSVAEEDIETVVKKLIASPPPHLVRTWQELANNDKLVAAALASIAEPGQAKTANDVINYLSSEKYPRIPNRWQVQRSLAALRRADLIVKTAEAAATHVFTMDFVRRWIADSRSIWDLLDERREDVMSRTAQFLRRLFASAVDMLITLLPVYIFLSWYRSGYLILIIVPLYYAICLPVFDRTIAMRIANLGVSSKTGTAPVWWRSLLFSLFLTVESFSVGLLPVALGKNEDWLYVITGVLLFIELLHQAQLLLHKQHRGLYDRLARVVVTFDPRGGGFKTSQ